MKTYKLHFQIIIIFLSYSLDIPLLTACTTFSLKNDQHFIVGYNFDYNLGSGFIVINQRNKIKTAFVLSHEKPAKWISKYGSITFNHIGKEYPFCGMNEQGLVVTQMYTEGIKYPEIDERYALDQVQWMQYQLDNCKTVDEILMSDKKIRISAPMPISMHYFVSDAYGHAAIIEFIDGKLVYYDKKNLPVELLGNCLYSNCLDSLSNYVDFGGEKTIPNTFKDCYELFAIGAKQQKNYNGNEKNEIADYAFGILNSVKGDLTQWSILFDISTKSIYFKTRISPKITTLKINDFNFKCNMETKVLDVNIDAKGDILKCFTEFTIELNRKYVNEAFGATLMEDAPKELIEGISVYPSSIMCKE